MNDFDDPLAAVRDAHRFAAYFAPAVGSVWWDAGSVWLGRCAARQQFLPQPPLPRVPVTEQRRLTQAPRRYGWHATLKAPFALAPGADASAMRDTLRALCRTLKPFNLPSLEVTLLDDFLALVPKAATPSVDAVAAACVTQLHPFAAPLSADELRRRRAAKLTPEEDALLLKWGYPFVHARFRFHMSLTGALTGSAPGLVEAMRQAAAEHFDGLPPCRFESVALFAEPRPGADFVLVEQLEFGR